MFVCAHVAQLQVEIAELHKTLTENIEKLQHKADQESLLLERKMQALVDNVENTEAQLSSVLSATNMDHTALREITSKAEVIIQITFLFSYPHTLHLTLNECVSVFCFFL